jgi:hypothetical protein
MTLARLLTLNNRIHDLENQMRQTRLRMTGAGESVHLEAFGPWRIAQLQEEIDREARASLVTCWFGMPDGADR